MKIEKKNENLWSISISVKSEWIWRLILFIHCGAYVALTFYVFDIDNILALTLIWLGLYTALFIPLLNLFAALYLAQWPGFMAYWILESILGFMLGFLFAILIWLLGMFVGMFVLDKTKLLD